MQDLNVYALLFMLMRSIFMFSLALAIKQFLFLQRSNKKAAYHHKPHRQDPEE